MSDESDPFSAWRSNEDGDAIYLSKTLRHEPVEMSLSDAVSRQILVSTQRRATFSSFFVFIFFLFIWLASGGLGSVFFSGSQYAGSNHTDGLFTFGIIASITTYGVVWLAFLTSTHREPIAEWRVLLADRANVADSVYSHIVGRLRERRLPIQAVTPRRTAHGADSVDNRLILVDGHYEVYVSVFEYGTSLYLGWTMWRARPGNVLLKQYRADKGAGDPLDVMLRTEQPRAMREAAHAICREGLHIAVENIEIPVAYGFPHGMPPIEKLPDISAPSLQARQYNSNAQQWPQPPVAQ